MDVLSYTTIKFAVCRGSAGSLVNIPVEQDGEPIVPVQSDAVERAERSFWQSRVDSDPAARALVASLAGTPCEDRKAA